VPIIRALGYTKRSPPSSPPSPPPVLDEQEGSRHGHPLGALDRREGDKMRGVIKNKIKQIFLTYPPAWWRTPAPVRCLWPPPLSPFIASAAANVLVLLSGSCLYWWEIGTKLLEKWIRQEKERTYYLPRRPFVVPARLHFPHPLYAPTPTRSSSSSTYFLHNKIVRKRKRNEAGRNNVTYHGVSWDGCCHDEAGSWWLVMMLHWWIPTVSFNSYFN